MLYDPKWKRETVQDLIAWLETKPPEGRYNFAHCGECLIAQWMDGAAMPWPAEIGHIYDGEDKWRIAAGPSRCHADWTYGAALARARAHVVSVPQ